MGFEVGYVLDDVRAGAGEPDRDERANVDVIGVAAAGSGS